MAEEKTKGPASYFPSIEKTYGKPIAHWLDVLSNGGERKHMEYVALLKEQHQMGHGHANALVAHNPSLVRWAEGAVVMDKNFTLEADEMAQGYVLSCQARATTKHLRISFDER